MLRELYNIGGYQYVVDLYDANKDLQRDPCRRKFVMLRNFTLTNEIITDNDIYFIEKDIFDRFIKEIYYSKDKESFLERTTKLVFPIPEGNVTSYSDSYAMFNSNFKNYSLYYNYAEGSTLDEDTFEYGTDVYELIDKYGNPKLIDCNVARLYHPANSESIKSIIYVDNYINDIHFHYFCNLSRNYTPKSETEFRINNYIYSEYIEFAFPNIEQLFKYITTDKKTGKEIFNVYFQENLNTIISTKNDSFIDRIIFDLPIDSQKQYKHVMKTIMETPDDAESYFNIEDDKRIQRVPLNLLIQPFRIVKETNLETGDSMNVKLYIKQFKSFENNYITYPVNITLCPYDFVDKDNNQYIPSYEYTVLTNTFVTDYKFSIISEIGFDNSVFSILTKFTYPEQEKWIKEFNGDETLALREAYKFYYNINLDDYKYFWVNRLLATMPEEQYELLAYVEEHWWSDDLNGLSDGETMMFAQWIIDENGDKVLEDSSEVTDREKLRRIIDKNYKGIKDELRDWEIEDEYETAMDFIGYRIQIYSDKYFKNVMYDTTVTSTFESLDNFAFNIDNIFESWNEVPDILICKITYIDRILGLVLISNVIPLHKEAIKYMIVKDVPTIHTLNKINNEMKEITLNKDILEAKQILFGSLDQSIDALANLEPSEIISQTKVIIRQYYEDFITEEIEKKRFNFIDTINVVNVKETKDTDLPNTKFNSSIMFKPVYFRTYELQNIKLRSNVTQRIGINLNQYMSKVEAFKLKIEDIELTEIGRNDIYVIFEINSNMLTTSGGTYNVVNQDDEYISSGSWIIY